MTRRLLILLALVVPASALAGPGPSDWVVDVAYRTASYRARALRLEIEATLRVFDDEAQLARRVGSARPLSPVQRARLRKALITRNTVLLGLLETVQQLEQPVPPPAGAITEDPDVRRYHVPSSPSRRDLADGRELLVAFAAGLRAAEDRVREAKANAARYSESHDEALTQAIARLQQRRKTRRDGDVVDAYARRTESLRLLELQLKRTLVQRAHARRAARDAHRVAVSELGQGLEELREARRYVEQLFANYWRSMLVASDGDARLRAQLQRAEAQAKAQQASKEQLAARTELLKELLGRPPLPSVDGEREAARSAERALDRVRAQSRGGLTDMPAMVLQHTRATYSALVRLLFVGSVPPSARAHAEAAAELAARWLAEQPDVGTEMARTLSDALDRQLEPGAAAPGPVGDHQAWILELRAEVVRQLIGTLTRRMAQDAVELTQDKASLQVAERSRSALDERHAAEDAALQRLESRAIAAERQLATLGMQRVDPGDLYELETSALELAAANFLRQRYEALRGVRDYERARHDATVARWREEQHERQAKREALQRWLDAARVEEARLRLALRKAALAEASVVLPASGTPTEQATAALRSSPWVRAYRARVELDIAIVRRDQARIAAQVVERAQVAQRLAQDDSRLHRLLAGLKRGRISKDTASYLARSLQRVEEAERQLIQREARILILRDARLVQASGSGQRLAELQLALDASAQPLAVLERLGAEAKLRPLVQAARRLTGDRGAATQRALVVALDAELRPVLTTLQSELAGLQKQFETMQAQDEVERQTLAKLRGLLLRSIYWLRDQASLLVDIEAGQLVWSAEYARVPSELAAIASALGEAETWSPKPDAPGNTFWRVLGALLLALLGLALMLGLGDRALPDVRLFEARWAHLCQQMLLLLVLTGVPALALLVAALLVPVGERGLSDVLGPPARALLIWLSVLLFVRSFFQRLLRQGGFATRHLSVSREMAEQLRRALRRSMWLGLVIGVPWAVLDALPDKLGSLEDGVRVVPRLLWTVMLAGGAYIALRLQRPGGPLLQAWTGNSGFWTRVWRIAYPVVALALMGIVLMDVLGYRIGAWMFTVYALQLLGIVLLLAAADAAIAQVVIKAAYAVLAKSTAVISAREEAERAATNPQTGHLDVRERYKRFRQLVPRISDAVGTVVVAGGFLLLVSVFGLFTEARASIAQLELYTFSGEPKSVLTLADVLVALCWIAGGHYLLYHLPAFNELFEFLSPDADNATRYVVTTLTTYAILVASYTAALINLHFSPASLGWLMAALSFGIGFGLQEIIANFVSGLILLLERPVRVGDIITVGGHSGTVRKINIRSTMIGSFDGKAIVMPNKALVTSDVLNWTYDDRVTRRQLAFSVAYGTDARRVEEIVLGLLAAHPGVLAEPAPSVIFSGLGESSLDFVAYWRSDLSVGGKTQSEMHQQIHDAFAEEGIDMPFPHREVKLTFENEAGGPAALEAALRSATRSVESSDAASDAASDAESGRPPGSADDEAYVGSKILGTRRLRRGRRRR